MIALPYKGLRMNVPAFAAVPARAKGMRDRAGSTGRCSFILRREKEREGRTSVPVVADQHGPRRLIGPEILGAVDCHQFGKARAGPVDARLDRADRAAANVG